MTGGGLAKHPSGNYAMLSLSKAALLNVSEGMHASMASEGIHLATITVNDYIPPGSDKAVAVAEHFWAAQTQPQAQWTWEVSYPEEWMLVGM